MSQLRLPVLVYMYGLIYHCSIFFNQSSVLKMSVRMFNSGILGEALLANQRRLETFETSDKV